MPGGWLGGCASGFPISCSQKSITLVENLLQQRPRATERSSGLGAPVPRDPPATAAEVQQRPVPVPSRLAELPPARNGSGKACRAKVCWPGGKLS